MFTTYKLFRRLGWSWSTALWRADAMKKLKPPKSGPVKTPERVSPESLGVGRDIRDVDDQRHKRVTALGWCWISASAC